MTPENFEIERATRFQERMEQHQSIVFRLTMALAASAIAILWLGFLLAFGGCR